MLAGCGGEDTNKRPTRVPTRIPPTPTPRSTALPPATPAPVIGSPERPIELLITTHEESPSNAKRQATAQLQDALETALNLNIDVTLVSENEALAALCSGAPVAAWVSPFTYATAQRTCELEPMLTVKRGSVPDFTIGLASDLVSHADISAITDLRDKVFCRSEAQDRMIGWGIPALLLSDQGVDPFQDLAYVRDFPDDLSLLAAIYTGDCGAGALAPDTFDSLIPDLLEYLNDSGDESITTEDIRATIHMLIPAAQVAAPPSTSNWTGFTTGTVPFATFVLSSPRALPTEYRTSLLDVVKDFFTERASGQERTRLLLDADGIMPVKRSDYRQFIRLLEKANWNMALAD